MAVANPDLIPAWRDGTLQPFDKLQAHLLGLRHKAVSVFLMSGRDLLIQKRALGKYHTPGLWANTCCTHPFWGESDLVCALRRLDEELGISGVELKHRGQIEYRADVGGGMVEHELVSVFVGIVDKGHLRLTPDPAEVMETEWQEINALRDQVRDEPEQFTPWIRIYLLDHFDTIFGG